LAEVVPKKALREDNFLRPLFFFKNARTAFRVLLASLGLTPEDRVLLPSYIGWSPREGSGIFDPIVETGVSYSFYRLNSRLHINLEDYHARLRDSVVRAVVFIHYFGYPDPLLDTAAKAAKAAGVVVIEDEAHALYSDWVMGSCGRLGDYSIYSLHKMLPFESGGLLRINTPQDRPEIVEGIKRSPLREPLVGPFLNYDLWGIAEARRENARHLLHLLRPMRGLLEPLYENLPDTVVPQTLPCLVRKGSRDRLYHVLNEAGFGLVSLYHTLISQISADDYPESAWLSKHIINLPVHQDADKAKLEDMIRRLRVELTSD
jgi:dTDP-4-amino-4,6-dideoxygalactose transaminase